MTLLLVHVEEIDHLLLKLPQLVDVAESGDSDAPAVVRAWLVTLEHAFERNRVAAGTTGVAALRAELALAQTGALPSGVSFAAAAPGRRRVRQAAVLDILRRSEQCVASILASSRGSQREAEALMQQIGAIARHKGLPDTDPPGPPDEPRLRAVWAMMLADPDLATGAVRILGLVPEADALVLLSRALATR